MGKSAKSDLSLINQHIGSRIRFYRVCARMTQKELGDELGVSAGQVGKYERGEDNVDAATLLNIARILECKVADFFEGVDDPDALPAQEGSEKLRRFMDSLDTVPPQYWKSLLILSRSLGVGEE